MTESELTLLLHQVRMGALDPADAARRLRDLSFEDLGFAKVDHQRAMRQGVPEVVFAEGKTVDQIVAIVSAIRAQSPVCLVTRISIEKAAAVQAALGPARHSEQGRTLIFADGDLAPKTDQVVSIVTAGTSDLPVADEAAETLYALGIPVARVTDVGVAGIHRLFAHHAQIQSARVVIVIAGMEGALPSVIGGLTNKPVIAVPTSIGYGTALSGFTALFAMLTSCASGVTVVNIDNGFGAAFAAARIVESSLHANP
jgi:NCAIR mutase (PurE)-related protein